MRRGGAANWLRQGTALGFGLAALALADGSLGNLSRELDGVLAVTALAGLAVLSARPAATRPWRAGLSLAVMAATLPFVARGGTPGLLAASLFFIALSLVAPREQGVTAALSLTAMLFAVYQITVAYLPALWHAQQWLSITFSWFVGAGLMLGPTALGLPVVVLFGFFGLATFLLAIQAPAAFPSAAHGGAGEASPTKWRTLLVFLLWLVALVLALAAYLWLQPPLTSWLVAHWPVSTTPAGTTSTPPTLTYLETPAALFLLLWIVSALATIWVVPRPLSPATPRRPATWAIAGLATLALGTCILTLDPPLSRRPGTILIQDAGQMDWARPAFGHYGAHSGGDFGLLPDYFAACGYQARIGPLTEENLRDVRVVVLVNLPQSLSPAVKERLLAFVRGGGGLVIWGEHTGLGRIREPINDLLAGLPGAPIQLKFDSAVPVRQGWAEGLTFLPHPVLYGVHNPVDMVIAVGASLAIQPPARPLIVGRFGHSDAGDVANRALNYVGDMRYNRGERLGDVVLAAEVDYGQGHIVVMGDTTPLGSVNMMTTLPFHARLVDWLAADSPGAWSLVLHNGWLAGLVLLAAGICLLRLRSPLVLAGAALTLGATLALTTYVNDMTSTPALPTGPIAYVDASHQERFDRLLWEDSSIGGLNYNLVRNGTLPLLLRHLDAESLSAAEVLVVIAPGQPFSPREMDTIAHWVEEGGTLLVSTGFEESQASESLLSDFGLRIDNVPLGPATVPRGASQVRFHEAWPVVSDHEDAHTIVEAYGYPLALYQPWGQGSVILIGDSEFLLGGTLEAETTYEPGNILLLHELLTEALAGQAPVPAASSHGDGEP